MPTGGNATDEKLPPLIIFKCKNVWDSWIPKEVTEYKVISYAATSNGRMKTITFANNFEENLFTVHSAVFIYDGYTSHTSMT